MPSGSAGIIALPQIGSNEEAPAVIQNIEQDLVNARELHAFLESGWKFSDWIKTRIEQHKFREGVDYIVFQDFQKNPIGGRPTKEYLLTIRAAKHISMAEHTWKGEQARDYFIECERIAKGQAQLQAQSNCSVVFGMCITKAERVSRLPFSYGLNKVRVIKDEQDEPWWIAGDVCKILGLVNITETMRRLNADEKGDFTLTEVISGKYRDYERKANMYTVNEPGLYKLILRSDKPEAKDFQRWITHEVLPRIRKTGAYFQGESEIIYYLIKSS